MKEDFAGLGQVRIGLLGSICSWLVGVGAVLELGTDGGEHQGEVWQCITALPRKWLFIQKWLCITTEIFYGNGWGLACFHPNVSSVWMKTCLASHSPPSWLPCSLGSQGPWFQAANLAVKKIKTSLLPSLGPAACQPWET